MRNIHNYILVIAFNVLTILSYGQDSISPDSLKINIKIAFTSIEETDSLFFDTQVKQEFILDYLKYFGDNNSEQFNNQELAKKIIQYYSTPDGIKNLILGYNETMNDNSHEIFSIGMKAYMKVYMNTDNPHALMMPNVLNKYALLLPKITPITNNTGLYLNSKFICLVKQAKNGVRVHSGKKYLLEFKLDQKVYCKDTITFEKQEQKIVKCNISD